MRHGAPVWRAMLPADLPACLALADELFPNHPEDPACFAERLSLSPATCLVLDDAGAVFGYAIAYPWLRDSLPALNARLNALPGSPDVLYLHDIAVHPGLAGRGYAREAVKILAESAKRLGLPAMALTAVNGTAPFWQAQGFSAKDAPAGKLASYGAGARSMERAL